MESCHGPLPWTEGQCQERLAATGRAAPLDRQRNAPTRLGAGKRRHEGQRDDALKASPVPLVPGDQCHVQ